jgi:pimeloyl-ACP methyl ester carboxylesterase
MATSRRFSISYRGQEISIAARTRSIGPDLVLFLHGLGCAKEAFDFAFDQEPFEGYSMCAIDFPCHGDSDQLPADQVSLDAFAEITRDIVKIIPHRRVFLVCHSMGGAVGVLAAQGLDELAGFVNVEGNLVSRDCGLVSRETANQSPDDFANSGFYKFADALTSSPQSDLRAWGRWYSACEPYGLHATARSLVDWSERDTLLAMFRQIPVRAYVHGRESQLDYLIPSLGDATVFGIPGSGHFPMLDNPGQFYPFVITFLTEATKHDANGQLPAGTSRARRPTRVRPRNSVRA